MGKGQQICKNWTKWVKKVKTEKNRAAASQRTAARARPAPLRARRHPFRPIFHVQPPQDVMLTSSMTSSFPLSVSLHFKIHLKTPPNTFFSFFFSFQFSLVFLSFQFISLSFRVLPFLGRTSYVFVIFQLFDSINGNANSAWRFSSNGNSVEVL